MLHAVLEKRNEDGTYDVRIKDDSYSGPTLWQVGIENGEPTGISWIDEETDEAIVAIPDDERVFEMLEAFARQPRLPGLEDEFPNRPVCCTRRRVKPMIDGDDCGWCDKVDEPWMS